MSKEILLVVESVSNEKNVASSVIFEAVEIALASATKKKFEVDVDVRVSIDTSTGDYTTYRRWTVVADEDFISSDVHLIEEEGRAHDPVLALGDVKEELIESIAFSRIAAQAAKQVIVQKVREAERRQIVGSYQSRIGELVSGAVKRIVKDFFIIDLGGNAEGYLLRKNIIPREVFRVGSHVRALLSGIEEDVKGPYIVLSRTDPRMIIELFRIEVPEIAEEVIEIKAASRDPGLRTKIAVKTNDGRIDPIGACVGMRGARVQAVSNELQNERVDIVLWDDDPVQFVISAMQPAEVVAIVIDEDNHSMDIAVAKENLSQAIGRGGQNVRLAGGLTGWVLNVMTVEEAEEKQNRESKEVIQTFSEFLNIEREIAEILIREGFMTLEEIAYVPIEELTAIIDLDNDVVDSIRAKAKDKLLSDAMKKESENKEVGTQNELLTLDNMSPYIAAQLADLGIVSLETLAEQATSDLLDLEGMDAKIAGKLIMEARNVCWFNNSD